MFGNGCFGIWASRNPDVGRSSNPTSTSAKHYFHQSNFHLRRHHFHQLNVYLARIPCINPASFSVKEGLFSPKQFSLRNNSLHESSFYFSYMMIFYFHLHSIETAASKRLESKYCLPKIVCYS